jgi:hypothetical protein
MLPRHQGRPFPVVFLQDGRSSDLFTWQGGRLVKAPGQGRIFADPAGRSEGLAAVSGPGPEDVAGVDCAAELARLTAGAGRPAGDTLSWTLVTSLARVAGPWPDVIAAYEANQAGIRAEGARVRAEMAAVDSRLDAVAGVLAVLGITPARLIHRDGGTVEIPVAQAGLLAALALQAAPDGMPGIPAGVTVWPLQYVASAVPLDHEDAPLGAVAVERLPGGTWAARRHGRCLSAAGTWDAEPPRSDRDDAWAAAHGFPLGEAIGLAARHARGDGGGAAVGEGEAPGSPGTATGLAFPQAPEVRPAQRRPPARAAVPAAAARPGPVPGT